MKSSFKVLCRLCETTIFLCRLRVQYDTVFVVVSRRVAIFLAPKVKSILSFVLRFCWCLSTSRHVIWLFTLREIKCIERERLPTIYWVILNWEIVEKT